MNDNKKKNVRIKPIPIIVASIVAVALIAATFIIVANNIKKSSTDESISVSVDKKNLKDDTTQTHTVEGETTVEIEFENCAVPVGTQLQMTALVTPADTEHALVWNTSDKNVIEIDGGGVLTVKGTGTAAVTATVGTVTDAVMIEGISNVASGSKEELPVYTGSSTSVATIVTPVVTGGSSSNASAGNTSGGGSSSAGAVNTDNNGSYNSDSSSNTDNQVGFDSSDFTGSGDSSGDTGNVDNTGNIGSSGTGNSSTDIAGTLPSMGFYPMMSNVYVCEDGDTYYGEIITQPNVTIIYIKKRNSDFDSKIQSVLAMLLPSESTQVWSNYLSASTDRTFTAEGRRVRIVVAVGGGHSQIVIYN